MNGNIDVQVQENQLLKKMSEVQSEDHGITLGDRK